MSPHSSAAPRRWLTLLVLLGTLTIVGCDPHYPVNAPEQRADIHEGYRLERVKADPDNPGDVLVILTLSGGGTRAASLAYGTMEALRDVSLKIGGRSRSLLDEVDIINAVSGGSIVAAYYAVHRDGLFRDFEHKFLKRDVESELRTALLANLPRLAHSRFSRGDLLGEYFDRELFDGATYADLARGSMRPFIVINAAALATGARFPFTQGQFDLLCSDLGSVPIGRAVAASAALPPFFSAITLQSYAGTCGPAPLPGLSKHPADVVGNLSTSVRLEETRSYLDRARRPYIHLVDGGLIDNLGLRVASDFAVEQGGFFELVEALGYNELTHVVFISVNAETDPNFAIDQTPDSPNFWQTLNALKLPGRAHSQDLAHQLQSSFDAWRDELRSRRPIPLGPADSAPRFYFIDVSISAIQDDNERNSFNNVPTALTLDAATVDRLRAIARRLLLESPALKQLKADLGS
ncbi:MAG TPA: patatin-like phospholipase family protein [Casimicrobiaceae bacterium]|nr:patatin-like phospholipase family protein [Casimicrobiaceae bacterium]